MKNIKNMIFVSTLLITTLLVACSTNVVTTAPTQTAVVQPTTAPAPVVPVTPAPAVPVTPTVPQAPQRTVIENGEVIVWAETFNRDETIKPIKYEATTNSNGTPIHDIYYIVDGHEIDVCINEKSGDRYFYKDGSDANFARIGSDVKSSNENILLQVNINKMLNEEIKKKYK